MPNKIYDNHQSVLHRLLFDGMTIMPGAVGQSGKVAAHGDLAISTILGKMVKRSSASADISVVEKEAA